MNKQYNIDNTSKNTDLFSTVIAEKLKPKSSESILIGIYIR